jgi:hypothetical protein
MKTQLLEDIGQSANLSLVPAAKASISHARSDVDDTAQARAAKVAVPRSSSGVWRQKPAAGPDEPAPQSPYQAPPPAQPQASPVPETAAVPEQPHVPFQPVNETGTFRAEPTLGANAIFGEPDSRDPLFDFLPPLPSPPASELSKREQTWLKRSGKRYLLWATSVLAFALIALGGMWLYEEGEDASAMAVVADESKADPHFDKVVKRGTAGAKEFTLGADGKIGAAPARALTPPPTSPAVPPLVLLKPEPASATPVKVEPAADKTPPAPLPKPVRKTEREQPVGAPKPLRTASDRAPARPLVREPVVETEKNPVPGATPAENLKACKAYGYSAAQCVKQACSMTKYGFVCRGK